MTSLIGIRNMWNAPLCERMERKPGYFEFHLQYTAQFLKNAQNMSICILADTSVNQSFSVFPLEIKPSAS